MSETEAAQLTGSMFLFEKPELLSADAHGQLGISRPNEPHAFCAKAKAIPITVTEIPAAMKDYPVIFMSQEKPIPLAVVALGDETNLFVDEKGEWEANRYIPGYIRRYPFGLANETSGDRMAIVIDRAFEGLEPGGNIALFENGELSDASQQAIEFCKTFERDRKTTDEFGEHLKRFDLIAGQTAQYTPTGSTEQQPFAQYFGVDEKKLNELTDDQVLELRKMGMLPILYAMVMSMGNWRSLLSRRAVRFGLSEDQVAAQNPVVN
ncbi:MAG: SapC family protein [Pseudomonadota bacterium]